jgi:hypothetical protein
MPAGGAGSFRADLPTMEAASTDYQTLQAKCESSLVWGWSNAAVRD